MTEYKNPYLLKRLEESDNSFKWSFTFRYMQYKRYSSVRSAFYRELKKLKKPKGSIKVLDIGCGDGWLTFRLKKEFGSKYKVQFFGSDLSLPNIEFAVKRKEYCGYDNCYFAVMDAQNLSAKNDGFDIVICAEVIEHMFSPQKVISEAHRVLKKEGLFMITTPQKNGGLFTKFIRLIKNKMAEDSKLCLQGATGNNEVDSTELGIFGAGHGHISVKTKKEWLRIFHAQGFQTIFLKGTGGFFFGGPYLDKHMIIFALSIILDSFLEKFPLHYLWTENLFFEIKK